MPTPTLNFTAGPGALPPSVLEQAQAEFRDYQGHGMSIMEMSHRAPEYEAINTRAEATFRRLLGLEGLGYRALFVQGGASSQFAVLPMNFLGKGRVADYVVTGTWGEKAVEEARLLGRAHVAASTEAGGFRRVPAASELQLSDDPSYVHLTSNETIQGVQFAGFPDVGDRPLVADMSSDILSRPFDASRFSLIYAGAQKNIGPAGVTVVLIRDSWLDRANADIPTMFRYATYTKHNSLYNTPPSFGVYLLDLVLTWIEGEGGLAGMDRRNRAKAAILYDAIDGSGGFYQGHAEVDSRSTMNVTFRTADEALEKRFLAEAKDQRMVGLAGHRSVGGIRASIYNAIDTAACLALAGFMAEFARRAG